MMFSVGLPFLVVYAIKRSSFWWALIPGGIMTVLAVIPILTTGVSGEIFGTFVMCVIALPFWAVYLANRRNWWPLVLIALGVVLLIRAGLRRS